MYTGAGALVAAVGQGGQLECGGGPVQGAEHLVAGGGEVVGGAGFDVGDPEREPVRCGHGLDVAAVLTGFSGVPQVDQSALGAGGLLAAAVGGKQLAVQDHVVRTLRLGAQQRVTQVGSIGREHVDHLVDVAVCRRPGHAMIAAQRGDVGVLAKPAQAHDRLPKAGQRPCTRARTPPEPLGRQQPTQPLREFARDVEHGTIGNHVESSPGRC